MKQRRENTWLQAIRLLITIGSFLAAAYKFYCFLRDNGILEEINDRYRKLSAEYDFGQVLDSDATKDSDRPAASKKKLASPKVGKSKAKEADLDLPGRASLLLSYLKSRQRLTMSEIRGKFPSVTARTLRRDLELLESKGLIRKEGKTRSSVYHYL